MDLGRRHTTEARTHARHIGGRRIAPTGGNCTSMQQAATVVLAGGRDAHRRRLNIKETRGARDLPRCRFPACARPIAAGCVGYRSGWIKGPPPLASRRAIRSAAPPTERRRPKRGPTEEFQISNGLVACVPRRALALAHTALSAQWGLPDHRGSPTSRAGTRACRTTSDPMLPPRRGFFAHVASRRTSRTRPRPRWPVALAPRKKKRQPNGACSYF